MSGSEWVGKVARAAKKGGEPAPNAPARATAPVFEVGHAFDPAERHADQLADQVLARLRAAEQGEREATATDSAHAVRRSATATAQPVVGIEGGPVPDDVSTRIERARANGTPLPAGVRARMESGFGTSLASVRVHTGDESARLNRTLSARAFTAGSDIFFGAGEYQPHTRDGERVLAHELAHTRQQSGVRRVHRLWDLDAAQLPWNNTDRIGTISSGQAVFFMIDNSGDKIVVKGEDKDVGIGELSSFLHVSLANVKSVRHRKLNAADKVSVGGLIGDKTKLDTDSWTKLGNVKKDVGWVKDDLKNRIAGMDEVDIAQYFQQSQLQALAGANMIAMTFAAGDTAAKVGASKVPAGQPPEKSRMRSLMTNRKHMVNIGQLTAVDAFMGNHDRALVGNLGNWIYDPHSAMITTIDHVDAKTQTNFAKKKQTGDDLDTLLKPLGKTKLASTATKVVNGIATGLSDVKFSGDTDIGTWLDAEGGWRRAAMEESVEDGLKTGRELLVKTFSATRFTIGGKDRRKMKKSIKAAAKTAYVVDAEDDAADDPEYYYKILKARALWLKKH